MRSMWQRVLHDEGGWLQFLPALIAAGGAAYAATRKKPNSAMEDFQVPTYQEDPDYRKTQDYMRELGINVLEGDIPEYYKGIGETGGPEFENYLNMITGDIQGSALETAAATGRGGGAATEIASRAVGEATTQSRYAERLRALEGKKWLFGEGRGITEGVRTAGQQEGVNKNQFNLSAARLEMDKRKYWDVYDEMGREWEAEKGAAIGSWLNAGAGAAMGAAGGGGFAGGMAGLTGQLDWMDLMKKGGSGGAGGAVTGVTPSTKLSLGSIGSGALNIKEYLAMLQ